MTEASSELVPTAAAYKRLFVATVLGLGLMARAATFQSPLFDFHSWRQADTASISRNFVNERFDPRYPQVDVRGARQDGYVETGFELYAFLIACLARIVGFSTELGRLGNVLLFPVAAWMLYRFASDRHGDAPALVSLALYSVGFPLSLYMDRAFMNESLLVLLTIACLRSAQRYLAGAPRASIVMAGATILIAITKPTYLIVWGPIVGLFIERYGWRALVRRELWLLGVLTALAGWLWFRHAHTLYQSTGLSFGIGDKLFDPEMLLSLEFASKIATRLVKDVLGPVGLVFGAWGLVVAIRRRLWAEALGVAAFVVYLAAVTPGNFHHNYYQLPIVPVGAVLAGVGLVAAIEAASARWQWTVERRLYAAAAIVGAALLGTYIRSVSFHSWYEVDQSRVRICEELRPLLRAGERVVLVGYDSPDILFCLGRKGWLLEESEATAGRLDEIAKATPAVLLVQTRTARAPEPIASSRQPLARTPEFVSYRLTD